MLPRRLKRPHIIIAAITLLFCTSAAQAQTTAFTYQGKLSKGGNPANGDGSDLTNLNANQLVSGTMNDAKQSLNIAKLDAKNIFTGCGKILKTL